MISTVKTISSYRIRFCLEHPGFVLLFLHIVCTFIVNISDSTSSFNSSLFCLAASKINQNMFHCQRLKATKMFESKKAIWASVLQGAIWSVSFQKKSGGGSWHLIKVNLTTECININRRLQPLWIQSGDISKDLISGAFSTVTTRPRFVS